MGECLAEDRAAEEGYVYWLAGGMTLVLFVSAIWLICKANKNIMDWSRGSDVYEKHDEKKAKSSVVQMVSNDGS